MLLNCLLLVSQLTTTFVAKYQLSGTVALAKCQLTVNPISTITYLYTAVWLKVVGKSARDNPQRCCWWFCLPCSPKKFERMTREATDICSRELMESNKRRFDT